MQKYKLARFRWQLGQSLLPEHFSAAEDSLQSQIRFSAELQGLPYRGIAALAWNQSLITEGTVAIASLTAVLPGGFLVDVPTNASLSPFSIEATGKSKVALQLHLLTETRSADGVPLYADDPKTVQRVLYRLQLSAEPAIDGEIARLKLAELEKRLDGSWQLSPAYVPPLLLVGTNPFLDTVLINLATLLERARNLLVAEIHDSYLRSDRLTNARRLLFEVRRVQAILDDMKHQIYPHPHPFFDAVRELYFEMCCYLESLPEEELPAYDHDDLATGFNQWIRLLGQGLRPERQEKTHAPLTLRDGQFSLSPLPKYVNEAGELYLLIQRTQPGEPNSVEGLKLASPSRLPIVRRLALRGIPFKYVPHPAFPHGFGPEIDFYLLTQGEEWQAAMREEGFAFFATPSLERSQISLFWHRQ